MESDLDLFDDIFSDGATKKARAGTMFQPKAKARPRKQSSTSICSTDPIQVVDIPQNESTDTCRTEEASQSIDNTSSGMRTSNDNRSSLANPISEHVATSEVGDPITGLHQGIVIPDSNGTPFSCIGKSAGENADLFIGLESLDNFLCQPETVTVNAENRFPLVVGMSAQMENKLPSSCPASVKSTLPCLETETIHVSNVSNSEEGFEILVASPGDVSERVTQNSSMSGKVSSSFNAGDFHIENRSLGLEQVDVFPSVDNLECISDLTTISGRRMDKFQPKPKVQIHTEKSTCSVPNVGTVDSLSRLRDAQVVPSEAELTNEGASPVLATDYILELSPTRFSDFMSMDPTSELPATEEPTLFSEIDLSGATIAGEQMKADTEIHVEVKTPIISAASLMASVSAKHKDRAIASQELGLGRSSRQQRKQQNALKPINESDDGVVDAGDFPLESSTSSFLNEDSSFVKESERENESQRKRGRRNSKKPMVEKEKPLQKHKKATRVTEQSTKAQPKRFRHSTTQKRRRVDKALLDLPEDERRNLPLRDRILLWEYSEQISKKEAAASETPSMYHRTGNPDGYYDEYQTSTRESNDEQTNTPVQESLACFNYQTFMNKTPRVTWSKQDTELFYEAVRQFGTDLSLIQQLFPGRTRKQVKLKYKKEERQQPLMLHEALTNRAKDHSHYKLVIERLQQAAAQESQYDILDDPVDLTGEEAEVVTPEINEEEANSELVEEAAKNMEPLIPEVQSPVNSIDSDDDLYRWDQYKSEI